MHDNDKMECNCCKNDIEGDGYFYILGVMCQTDKHNHFIGLQKTLDEVANFAMNKGYHLSASQIMLLRPDIVNEFFEQKYTEEKTIDWYFDRYCICGMCYEEYANLIPLT